MNMKKSIAGVMAGALAVSAMATTASAWTGGDADQAQIVLSYDLNKKEKAYTDSTITLTYKYAGNTDGYVVEGLKKGGKAAVQIGATLPAYDNYTLDVVNINGYGLPQKSQTGEQSPTYTVNETVSRQYVKGTDGKNETKKITPVELKKDENGNIYAYVIDFSADGSNSNAIAMDGLELYKNADPDTVEYSFTVFKTTPAAPAVPAEYNDVTYVDVADTTDEVGHQKYVDYVATQNVKGADATKVGDIKSIDIFIGDGTNGTTAGHTYAKVTKCSKAKVEAVAEKTENETKTFKDETTYKYELAKAQAEAEAANKNKPGSVIVVDNGKTVIPGAVKDVTYGFASYTITLTYTANPAGDDWGWRAEWAKNEMKGINPVGKTATMNDVIPAVNYVNNAGADYFKPLASNPTEPANVITRLTENGYTYPQAVLNDVIANNENVAFTFTTAQKYVDTRAYIKVEDKEVISTSGTTAKVRVTNPAGGRTTKTLPYIKYNNTVFVENPYYGVAYDGNKKDDFLNKDNALWYNPYFTQDLYQTWTWKYLDGVDNHKAGNGYNQFGPNGTQNAQSLFGSYASQWNKNLLAAGLVVNSAWTMQLNQATAFEWGDQTITFFWDDITADANVTNAANFLTSLQLYTPVEWFWDKMDVSVGAAIAEDVASNAGLEEDVEEVVEEEEVIEEEPVEEEIDEDLDEDFDEDLDEDFDEDLDEDLDEDFDEDLDEEEEEPVEEEVVVEVESPKTGNAPIALAVIPVALAASAVIAKKKN